MPFGLNCYYGFCNELLEQVTDSGFLPPQVYAAEQLAQGRIEGELTLFQTDCYRDEYRRTFAVSTLEPSCNGSTPPILNAHIPPLMPDGTQYHPVECGPPSGCAEREVGVGSMRVRMTFLWMSDPISFSLLIFQAQANHLFVTVCSRPSKRSYICLFVCRLGVAELVA